MHLVRISSLRCLFVLAGVAALASCGSGEPEATQPATALTVAVAEGLSPLEAAVGFASEPARRQYQIIAMQRDANAEIVRCMQEQGFSYAVGSTEAAFRSGPFVGDGSREWTSVNGLGITSSFVEVLTADTTGSTADAEVANRDYVQSLTAEQAALYDAALIGDLGQLPTTDAEYEPAGCWGDAFGPIVRVLTLSDEFKTQLASLNSRLQTVPRLLGFHKTWSDCMAANGYVYGNDRALIDDVYARLLEIELVEVSGITRVVSLEELEALKAFELQTALVSFDCRQSFVSDLNELRYDYEREFLDDNRFRLNELEPTEP